MAIWYREPYQNDVIWIRITIPENEADDVTGIAARNVFFPPSNYV